MKVQLKVNNLTNPFTVEELQKIIPFRNVEEPGIIGQNRAEKAISLGLGIKSYGFNIFVSGVSGTGKLTAVKSYLNEIAVKEPVPSDWCYINNFDDPYQPKKLSMPAGHAIELKKDIKAIIQEARQSLVKAFESEEYANRKRLIQEKYEAQESTIINAINQRAEKESLIIKQTPLEIFTIPIIEGVPMTDEQFLSLPKEKQEKIHEKQNKLAEDVKEALRQTRKLAKAATEELNKLEKEVAAYAISNLIEDTEEKYTQIPEVIEYLKNLKNDILGNLTEFLLADKSTENILGGKNQDFLKRYEVNVLVDNSRQQGAPIIIESNPTYNNLIGRVEKESVMGTLLTDFTMIRKGALHSANGGYLVIRAEELFKNYFSWEALKRTIKNKEVLIEEATDKLGYLTTKSIKPEPIPLKVKVILVGDPLYYHLLYSYDIDFRELFKVKADFDSSMNRTDENIGNYIAFINSVCELEKLGRIQDGAMAKIIEFGSRLADDQGKLSTRLALIADIIREADYYASQEKSSQITPIHVLRAINEKNYRGNLVQEKINELIERKQIFIDTTGSKTGQINGLSVIDLGDISFGRPIRITCSVNLGKGGIIAIEREAELSGPLHTKGVLILAGYLSEKYFQDKPISLSARVVFEQSYSEVEGDSASSTELYAILSNLANAPIKQGIAVTGSVNQKGEVQAIGGVNEKIEGYFELCKKIGLNEEQGVIIPSANKQNLMLKEEVLEAVANKKFNIWAIDTIDDGIELLTGLRAGSINEEGTIAYKVNTTLINYSEKMKEFSEEEEDSAGDNIWVSNVVG
ncbi:Lon protease family protein [Flavihumibacter profundi]|uniref:Lon protease family protein n=1 Tax=Flavihumibacter profundi TaxID=2716883 RepID=UPI001CC8040E|nr:ATP-binding protein [Flavihumibacter profundi]MBZ5856328.1 AAA family ATPase [Flavihumibacter profundi]